MSSLVRGAAGHKDSQWPPRQLSPVGILGGTGLVGRMLARALCDHPFLCCGPIVGSRYVCAFFPLACAPLLNGHTSPPHSHSDSEAITTWPTFHPPLPKTQAFNFSVRLSSSSAQSSARMALAHSLTHSLTLPSSRYLAARLAKV